MSGVSTTANGKRLDKVNNQGKLIRLMNLLVLESIRGIASKVTLDLDVCRSGKRHCDKKGKNGEAHLGHKLSGVK